MYKLFFLIILSACFKNPDFSLSFTQERLLKISKKSITHEDLNSKDFNLLFKTLRSTKLLNEVNNELIVDAIIFSKEKNLYRAYIEAFLAQPKNSKLKIGLNKLYINNPNLIKAYLEYFTNEEQEVIKKNLD